MTDLHGAYVLLGLTPGASPDEVAAAYRRRAKELHPDRTGEEADAARMAAVNAAHEVLTAALLSSVPTVEPSPAGRANGGATRPRRRPGDWLTPEMRRSLGPELVNELSDGEQVHAVVATSTWASPRTVLAVTDRRVVWLLDDAVAGRVRWLRFTQIAEVRATVRGRRRPSGALKVRPRFGRPATFADLSVSDAQALALRIEAEIASAPPR